MRSFKRLLLLTIIISSLAPLICSCELFEGLRQPEHVCSFDDVTVISEVGCDTDGITVLSCSCGRISTDLKSAYGHSFGEWEITAYPTCSVRGSEQRTCESCGLIETAAIATVYHDYSVTEEIVGDRVVNRYLCGLCGECFDLETDISLPEADGKPKYVYDAPVDFSFTIFCPEGEEYVRDHLNIFSYISGEESSYSYLLSDEGSGIFRVTPNGEYLPGLSYVARRSGGVVFPEYGLGDLVFAVKKEETIKVTGGEGVTYIAALESKSPGYYPYNLHHSKASGDYFLALEKADGLFVGQLICVGGAKNFEELFFSGEENTFGRITSISKLNDGRMLVAMSQPDIDEIFTALEVYSSKIDFFDKAYFTDDFSGRIKKALLSDKDYAEMLDAFYSSAELYAAKNGLALEHKSFADFIEAITATAEECTTEIVTDNGKISIVGHCGAICTATLPLLFNNEKLGEVTLEVRVYVNISGLNASVQLEKGEHTEGNLIFSFGMKHSLSVGAELDCYSNIVYPADSQLFALQTEGEIYHRAGCELLDDISILQQSRLSVSEMHRLIDSDKRLTECEICRPISYFNSYLSLFSQGEKIIHNISCKNYDSASRDMAYSEITPHVAEKLGYTLCPDCEETLMKTEFEDIMTETLNSGEIGKYADTLTVSQAPVKVTIGKFLMSLSGIDRQVISISVTPDFRNMGEIRYSYEYSQSFEAGFSTSCNGIISEQKASVGSLTKNGKPVTEATEYFVGCDCDVSVSLVGFGYTVSEKISFKTDTIVGLE